MSLATAFAESASRHPHKIGLYWGPDEFSYAKLRDLSLVVRNTLQNRFGIKPDDRVALWLKNCPEFVPAYFGILGAGAIAVPINNFLKPDEVNFILQDAGVNVLVTDAELGLTTGHSRPSARTSNCSTSRTCTSQLTPNMKAPLPLRGRIRTWRC